MVHEDLKAFLSSNLPSGQTVGIVDPKLLQVVKEEVGCKVQGGEVVQEVCRGIRLHMNKFVKALEEKKENMAQLGLGHSYSRSKVKFNVNRSDNMVIQAIALIDQLDKARISNRVLYATWSVRDEISNEQNSMRIFHLGFYLMSLNKLCNFCIKNVAIR